MTASPPIRVLVLTGPARDKEKHFWLQRYAPPDMRIDVSIIPITQFQSLAHRVNASVLHNLRILPGINRYDVILSVGSLGGAVLALLQTLTGRLFVKPHHITLDIALPRLLAGRGTPALLFSRFVFRSLAKIICYSNSQCRFWEERLGGSGRCIFTPLGIDLPALAGAETAPGEYLFCAGRAGRDYKTLLAALRDLGVRTVIVAGKDPIPTGDADTPLGGLAALPNTEVLEEIPYAEYRRLMAAAKLVVLPLEDSASVFGQVVLLEAMALGKPVAVSRVNGTADYVRDRETGCFVTPGNPDALRDTLTYLVDNPQEAERIGSAAAVAVRDGFTERVMAGSVAGLIRKLYDGNAKRKRIA